MIDTIGPLLALAPVRKRRVDQVAIVDGTLVPTQDHRPAAPSKNQGNPEVIMPYRKRGDGQPLADWQEDRNTVHRKVRARVEHALGRRKTWKVLRDYRRAAHTLRDTALGIAHLHNITISD